MLDYFATSGPIWLKGAGCPGRTTAPTGGGSSWFLASPLGGAACCGALQPLLLVADAASGNVSRLCGGRRGPTALCCEPRQAIADARRRSKCSTRALGCRASSRRTHRSGREAPQDYSSRSRRAGLQPKGPRRVAAAAVTPSPQQLENQECATNVISGARGPGGQGRRSVRAPAAGFAA